MSSVLGGLFTAAIDLTGRQRFLLMLPLCLSIAVVYKTIRCDNLRAVPLAALTLWITIIGGMFLVGTGLWLLFRIMV